MYKKVPFLLTIALWHHCFYLLFIYNISNLILYIYLKKYIHTYFLYFQLPHVFFFCTFSLNSWKYWRNYDEIFRHTLLIFNILYELYNFGGIRIIYTNIQIFAYININIYLYKQIYIYIWIYCTVVQYTWNKIKF